jgi:UDP-N-acetylmuramoyl-L-alanyl-D-glutamate--2,6-diaminopimelate ligase
VIHVRSTRQALAWCAAALHRFPGRAMPVVGVTGTNGKTTTTTVIEEALHREGVMVGRIGTTGNAIALSPRPTSFTTPEAPQLQALLAEMREAGCQAVAMEASSVGLAQHRVDGIPFHVAVFTNFTRDHLLEHGTMEAYHAAKERLFRELLRPAGGPPRAILCADDPEHLSMGAPADQWTYGFSEGADLRIVRMSLGPGGTHLVLHTPDGPLEMHSPLVGRHNALNLTAAYGVLRTLDLPPDRAAAAVGSVQGVPGRLERVPDPAGRLVLVDYAHTDDALLNVLPTVRELTRGTLWVLFGCGGDRDRGKRPKMGEVARQLADRVVVTSDNPRSEEPAAIVDDILAGIADRSGVHVELDREAAIRWVLRQAQPGDGVLLAGKGHETYQEIAGVRRPFDDREVARQALKQGVS